MFDYVSGILDYKGPDHCVVDVGGVGFKLNITPSASSRIGMKGEKVKLYTFLSVKEDELSLYGFESREELSAFTMLLGVSGVGPKVAMQVLNTLSPSDFSLAVATGDYKAISRSKGVGPKLAQRIVLELKDKVSADLKGVEKADDVQAAAVVPGYAGADAVAALMVLGYTSKEASDAVRKVYKDGMKLEEIVRQALRQV